MFKNPRISIDKINKIKSTKNLRELKVFEYLYSRTEIIIEKAVKSNKDICYYTVPPFVFGYPVYGLEEAIDYICKKLISNGLSPLRVTTDTIAITWNNKETESDDSEGHRKEYNNNSKENNSSAFEDELLDSLMKYKTKF
jgi:hypothetical protein